MFISHRGYIAVIYFIWVSLNHICNVSNWCKMQQPDCWLALENMHILLLYLSLYTGYWSIFVLILKCCSLFLKLYMDVFP